MVVNPITLRLVSGLSEGSTGRTVLEDLAEELPDLDSKVVYEQGIATLERLREAEIILGSKTRTQGRN